MSNPSLREISKLEFDSNNTIEHINAGSFQRMADACEKMAVNFKDIHAELERTKNGLQNYKNMWLEEQKRTQYLKASNTKLRNRLMAIEQKGVNNG